MVRQQLIPRGISGLRPLNEVEGKTCQNRTASQAWHSRKEASEAEWWERWRPGQTESEGVKDEKTREKAERGRRCQREERTKWYQLKTVGDMGGEWNGQEWKNWVRRERERAGVQAQRGMNPVTLLGSRLVAPSACRAATATLPPSAVETRLIREATALQTHCAPGWGFTSTGDHSRVWTPHNLRGLTSSCVMASVALDQGPCSASDAHAPIEAQIRREAVFKAPHLWSTQILFVMFYATIIDSILQTAVHLLHVHVCTENRISGMGLDYAFQIHLH